MAVNLSFIGGAGWQFFDNNGNVLSGGLLYTYAAGTTTPQTTYTSRSGTIANTNPIILDSAGRTPEQIWSTEGLLYKYVITDSNNITLRTWDNIGGTTVSNDLASDLANNTNPAKGDALVGFRQSDEDGILPNAVGRTVHDKLQDIISVKDFGAVGDGIADDTTALQSALNASQNKSLYINAGTYKITSALILDTNYNYNIYGDGKSEYAIPCTTIFNAGTGNSITINNEGSSNDNQFIIYDLNITSSSSLTRYGIYIYNVHGVSLNKLWISGHGFDGVYLEKSWGFKASDCTFAQNYRNGIYARSQNNNITFIRCIFNGNARLDGGYAGLFLTASGVGVENLGVNLIGCDLSYNGYPATTLTGLGLVVQYSFAVSVIGCYIELNKSSNIYADNTVKNLTVTGNYFQDTSIDLVQPRGLVYQNNHHALVSVTPYVVNISGYTSERYQNTVQNNTYDTNVTTNYVTGVKESVQIFNNASPTAGTWKQGDITWHTSPSSAGYIGWVCTVPGTPGTWNTFGLIS